jgi:predicted PurR-regulated permease PerM
MDYLMNFLQKTYVKRIVILLAICGLLYIMKSLLTLFLMTFVIIFLMNSMQEFFYEHIRKVLPIKRTIIIILLYVIFISLISIAAYIYIPVIAIEIKSIFKNNIPEIIKIINNQSNSKNILIQSFVYLSQSVDLSQYTNLLSNTLIGLVSNFGMVCLYFFLSSILSLFFMIEKDKISAFINNFKDSKISWVYGELCFFGHKFINSFGKVIEAQIIISFVNTVVSVIVLAILGFQNLLGLGTMIFFFGLIPVAGAIISLVPLSIIAFTIGGYMQVLYIFILIAFLHAFESYVLNPNIMSYKTKLPVFFTFLILIVSEHFLGIWGLLMGLPIAIFILDLLDVKPQEIYKPILKKDEFIK